MLLSRRVHHVERTIFHSLALNPLLSGCLSATRAGAARRSYGWFSPPHSSRMSRAVVLLFFFCRRSPVVVLVSRLLFGRRFVRDGSSPACIAAGCGCCSAVCGNSRVGLFLAPGRRASRKSRGGSEEPPVFRSSPAAHPGNRQFLLFSKPPNSSAAPATEMADGRCGVREVRTSD